MDTSPAAADEAPATRVAALLSRWLAAGGADDAQLCRWLGWRDLPYERYQLDWAYEAILEGILNLPGDQRLPMRKALARSLSRILDLQPERATDPQHDPRRDGGRTLTNIYALATGLDRCRDLADAVERAFLRGVPDIAGEHAPVARGLFNAAMMTQVDGRLGPCWSGLLSYGDDPYFPLPAPVRDTRWGIMWWDIWSAICRMPRPTESGVRPAGPSRDAIARALPLIAVEIQAEESSNADRFRRLEDELSRITASWPIDWRPFLAPCWLFLDLPPWTAPMFIKDISPDWEPDQQMVLRLERLRRAVRNINWGNILIQTDEYKAWMDPFIVLVNNKALPDMDGSMIEEEAAKFIASYWYTNIEGDIVSRKDYRIPVSVLKRTTAYALAYAAG